MPFFFTFVSRADGVAVKVPILKFFMRAFSFI